jgi:Adenylate kinase and related kinases
MNRILLIGSGGSGKSTLATRKLGVKLHMKVTHLDALFWKPGWVETPRDEWIRIQKQLVEDDQWIIDGNYGGTMDIRLKTADTVIFLDFSRWVCLYRVIRRAVHYRHRTRPDMGSGCNEKIDKAFLRWVWQFPEKEKPEIDAKLQKLSGQIKIITLKSPGEVRRFLDLAGI